MPKKYAVLCLFLVGCLSTKANKILVNISPLSSLGSPQARSFHKAVWTGKKMIIWGGLVSHEEQAYYRKTVIGSGAIYDLETGRWGQISQKMAPYARYHHTAIWCDNKMVIWGGRLAGRDKPLNDGAIYNVVEDLWVPLNKSGAPSPRSSHSAVCAGDKMIIWGGENLKNQLRDGAVYDFKNKKWSPLSLKDAPSPRAYHTAIWTGKLLLVWGGLGPKGPLGDGGAYNLLTDSWVPITSVNAPSPRIGHSAIWTGKKMLIWGGSNSGKYFSTGGIFNPELNTWEDMADSKGVVSARELHSAVWTGSKMIIWGGVGYLKIRRYGGIYDPLTNIWQMVKIKGPKDYRYFHSAIWTGSELILWGGLTKNRIPVKNGVILRINN